MFLPFILAAQLIASSETPAAIAPGTYTYKASLAGTPVGTSTVVVKSSGTSTEIDETSTGNVGGTPANGLVSLVLGPDLSPVTYTATGTQGTQTMKDSATATNSAVTITNGQGSKSFNLDATTKHFVVVDIGTVAGLMGLPAQMKAWNDSAVLAVVPMLGQSLPMAPDNAATPSRPGGAPSGDAALSFSGAAPFTIWYDPATNIADEIDIPAQGITVTRQR